MSRGRSTPDFRPFAATNQPGTCVWCGRPLKHETVSDYHGADGGRVVTKAAKAGSQEDDLFCGLRCGYLFGRAFAGQLGRRLTPKP